jgi:hypothetical protein
MLDRNQKLARPAIVTLTIFALFLAPLCGTLCAAPSHCAQASAIAHAETEDCHHLAISADDSDAIVSLAGHTNCAQPENVAILFDATKKQLSNSGLLSSTQVALAAASTLPLGADSGAAPLPDPLPFLATAPISTTTVLRT